MASEVGAFGVEYLQSSSIPSGAGAHYFTVEYLQSPDEIPGSALHYLTMEYLLDPDAPLAVSFRRVEAYIWNGEEWAPVIPGTSTTG